MKLKTLLLALAVSGSAFLLHACLNADAAPNTKFWTKNIKTDPGTATFAPAFALAMDGGTLITQRDLCDIVDAGDLSGAWHCLLGDGGVLAGSAGLTNNGPMATQTLGLCSGTGDCPSITKLNDPSATSYFSRAATTAPTGDFSVCVAFTNDPSISGSATMAKYTGGFNGAYDMESFISGSNSRNDFFIFSGASQAVVTNMTVPLGTENLMCIAYTLSTTSGVPYVNTTAGSTLTGITVDGTSRIHAVNAYSTGGLKNLGRYRGALFTEKTLSSADITRLFGTSISPRLKTYDGNDMTFVRASAGGCSKSDNTDGTLLRVSQPCVFNGGLWVGKTHDNLLLRSDAIANAAWADVGTPSAVTRGFTSAFGHTGLGSLTDNDAAAKEGRSQAVSITLQRKYTLSCWLRSSTATTATLSMVGTGDATGDKTCTITGLTSTPTRYSCTSDAAYGAALTAITSSVLVGDTAAVTGVIGAGDCQLEPIGWASPYTRTDGTAVVRSPDIPSYAITLSSGITTMKASVYMPAEFSSSFQRVMRIYKDANNYAEGYVDSTGHLVCAWVVGGSTYSTTTSGTLSTNAWSNLQCKYDGVDVSSCINGTCATSPETFSGFTGASTVYIGASNSTGSELDGLIKNVCFDYSITGCDL